MMSSELKEGFSGEELLTEVLGDPIDSPLEIEETPITKQSVTATPPTVPVDNTSKVISENVDSQQSVVAMETVEYAVASQEEDIVVDDIPGGSKSVSMTTTEPDQKDVILKFAEQYSISQASSRFKIPSSTIKKWMKASPDSATMLPKFNLPGQGRKLSYSTEKDESIASHIKEQLAKGEKVTLSYVSNYAKSIIQEENPQFIASSGWAQRFLIRHSIDLNSQSPSAKKPDHTPSSSSTTESRGRPLTYSSVTDKAIADYVRGRLTDGQTMSNSELRRYAKEVIGKESPNFTGSASWAQNFLFRHKIALQSPIDVTTPTPSYSHASSLSTGELHPAAEITPTTSTAIYPDMPNTSVAMDTSVDDTMKTALALLTGENIDSVILSPAQAAALQSSLSELTTDTVSLVDLLNNAQQLSEQGGDGQVALITHGLESPSGGIYLGLGGNEAFGSGLSGPAATQVNPNTQTPLPTLPAHSEHQQQQQTEMVTQASRPLSYAKETDILLANWVQEQQATGKKVTFASLRAYAKKLISTENPNFNASVGWVTPFLLRHNLDLNVNKKRKTRKGSTPRKISSDDPNKEREEDGEEVSGEEPQLQTADAPIITPEVLATAIATSLSDQEWSGPQTSTVEAGNTNTQTTPNTQSVSSAPESSEVKPTPKMNRRSKVRTRHTLAEKLEVVRLMKEHNLAAHHVCRMLGIANSTYAGWTKLVQQKGAELEALSSNKRRANVSGQGRPLSYSRDKDEAIADWVRSQQQMGVQVTPNDLAKHATAVISQENVNFTASSGWQQKFLQRHNLQLTTMWTQRPASIGSEKTGETPQTTMVEDQQSVPAPVQTEEVISNDIVSSDKPYSDEIEEQLIKWSKEQVEENGSLGVQVLCKKAEDLVIEQNPMFVATLGWAFKFLHRHNILLDPKPSTAAVVEGGRKRASVEDTYLNTPKKLHSMEPTDLSVSPSTGNLCEALLALSNQAGDGGEASSQSIQAAVQNLQNAMQVVQQHQAAQQAAAAATVAMATPPNKPEGPSGEMSSSSGSTYFGKPAREFTAEEKEEVVRYANATTLQKAALKYGVAAPTVWRWRVELKLHQPKYTPMQKKYIIKFAETNSLKEASQRYGITGKTIQNWRKALQAEGELPTASGSDEQCASTEMSDPMDTIPPGAVTTSEATEVVTYDNQNFQFIVDGGEVVDTSGKGEQNIPPVESVRVEPLSLEVTNEVDIENVGMEYDVVSSEGHAAKPRCTPQEKLQILEYALQHSVREASQKFGVSPGTLYYWKKSMGNMDASSATLTSTNPSDSIMTVQYSGMAGDTSVLQGLRLTTSEPSNEQFTPTSSTVPISSETIQTLPADINFLQAVTSLLSEDKQKTTPTRRHDSTSGGISSPTEVLVAPFQSSSQQSTTEVVTTETTQIQGEVEVSEHSSSHDLSEVGEEVSTTPKEQPPEQIETEIENISQTVELSDSVPTTSTAEQ